MKKLKNELRHWIRTSFSLAAAAKHSESESVYLVSLLP